VAVVGAPFATKFFFADSGSDGLIGMDRSKRDIVFARRNCASFTADRPLLLAAIIH
jgi:hypothetical protein